MADSKKAEIKVTVHYPDKLSESIRQTKIDRLYDILKPKSDEYKEGSADSVNADNENNDYDGEHDDKKTA